MKRQIWKLTGFRKKLIAYYLITIILMGLTSFSSYLNARMILNRYKSIFTDYIYLNSLNNDVTSLETEVEDYLSTKSSDSLLSYYTYYNKLQNDSDSIKTINQYDMDSLELKDIGNMIQSLLSETDAAINAKRGRISSEYIAHFTRSNQISGYIQLYVNNLLNDKLQQGAIKYNEITKNMTLISIINIFLILVSITLNIFLAFFLTYRLTKPIIELSHSAEKVSMGDFDVSLIEIKTDDELNVLSKAFNKMVISIRNYIDEIKNQAEMENMLKVQEMQNLKMKSVLKDSELKALQSQINPHFLFNTLNAASQLAMMEGAEKSSEFIENVADLFRYNLRKLDNPVTLEDEINNVKKYMYILKTRFGDKIKFFSSIDTTLLNIKMPCTIIQPVVENAFIHGLEDLERDGEIYLNVKKSDEFVLIEIIDNGMGMDAEKVKAILSVDEQEDISNKHVSGIGFHNIIKRLQLYFNVSDVNDVIQIESKIHLGTKVTLRIPLKEEITKDD